MGFEVSKFGDGSAAGSGNVVSTVHNHFGPRPGGNGLVGVFDTDGATRELVLRIDGVMLGKAAFDLLPPKLPKGAQIRAVQVTVTEAFNLGGTTPSIKVGTSGSEATNGVSLSEAQAEAVGTYNLTTLNGTWANPLAANTTVGIALAGTTPTTTTAGKARILIRYDVLSTK